jgi:toxin ParE1/3/4
MHTIYRVIFSPRAAKDLNSIFEFIERDSPQNAEKQLEILGGSGFSLAEFPKRYPISDFGRSNIETRIMPVGSYLIYYRILEPQKTVRIITVRHGARCAPRTFD